ncbi:hypothetical protein BH09MYX1_BH09MYX1_40550 [soil metagenome]
MLDRIRRITASPFRRDGILDCPLSEYLSELDSEELERLLDEHGRALKEPTLRGVLASASFLRWVEQAPPALQEVLAEELANVLSVVDATSIHDEDSSPSASPRTPLVRVENLREWAKELGISKRLNDSASVLESHVFAPKHLRRWIASAGPLTIGQLLDGPLDELDYDIARGQRAELSELGEAYIREIGERVIADRAEDARFRAGTTPEGEGARAFVAALDAAIARTADHATAGTVLGDAVLARNPMRLEAHCVIADRHGHSRAVIAALLLDDWRSGDLETKVWMATKDAQRAPTAIRLVLRATRRVIANPSHRFHHPLVAHLDEAPWTRVLATVGTLVAALAEGEPHERIHWTVINGEGGIRLVPFTGRAEGGLARQVAADSILGGAGSPIDQAVGRALWIAPSHSFARAIRAPHDLESRARVYRALVLLASHDGVCGRDGVPMRVVAGRLQTALAPVGDGFAFVFAVDGERMDASAVRASLDEAGYLIHVDPSRGHVLLSHLGTYETNAVRALASESAIFPEAAAKALVTMVVALRPRIDIEIPAPLAGESIEADARPLVRIVREGATLLRVTWLVRPIATGPTFASGDGPVQVHYDLDGRAVLAIRSLDEERRLQSVIRAKLSDANGTGIDAMVSTIETLRLAAEAGEITVEWPKTLPRVVGRAVWSKLRLSVTKERDGFGVDGTFDVAGTQVALALLLAARRRGERFVVVGKYELVAIEDELRSRLDELEAMARPTKHGLDLASIAVPAFADLLSSREQLDAIPAFWSRLSRVDAARASDPKLPRGFSKILRTYQAEGFRWMSRLAAWGAGACLADEMGLGKTVQTLALLVARRQRGPALVIAPTSVGPNWIHEAARFAPSLNPILHRGANRAAALATLGPGDLVVTSYDLLACDVESLAAISFSTVVLDEAQAIKNGATTRARAARSLQAEFRLALTGTPVENRLAELYSLMEFLNPGFFGSETDFRSRYVVPIERDRNPVASAALARLIRPFLLRRKKSEVLSELPARTEVTRPIERPLAERNMYEAARQLALSGLGDDDEDARFQILAEIMRLRRLACHPKLYDETSTVSSSKLEAFLTLVTELREAGHRALVFSQFTGHLALVREALRANGVPYLYLDGKTPVTERTRRGAAFQAGEGDLFLISLKAGGTGLNLTAADTVIHLDPWWNPAVEDQATDRAHRIGQTRPVTVIRLIAQGTIEEAVLALHADKREIAESILEGSAASGKLSIAELGALIREGVVSS